MSSLISAVAWVRRGVAAQHPEKYVLDDPELERVSALARIELEDARVELERAHLAAQSMGKGAEGDEADDNGDDGDEADWVESVIKISCDSFFSCEILSNFLARMMPWISIPVPFQRRRRMIYRNIIWMIMTMMFRLQASSCSHFSLFCC